VSSQGSVLSSSAVPSGKIAGQGGERPPQALQVEVEVTVDSGEQGGTDHIETGDWDRRVDDRQRRACGVQDQREVRRGADHQPGIDTGGQQADEDLACFAGDRGDLAERRKFRDVVRQRGAGQIGAGQVLGQEPFNLGEVFFLQVCIAEILESQGRCFFELLRHGGIKLLVHLRRGNLVGRSVSVVRP
jgi:hypothetical protein